jgi:tRNA-modifying protein YgfZ
LDTPVLVGAGVPWLAPAALDHVGDPDGERVHLLTGGAALVPRLARGHLRVRGADRVDFLHGQLSGDVRSLASGRAVDGLLLDHRGRPQAGGRVTARPDDLYVSVDDGHAPTVIASLEAHVVFDQVEIDDVAEGAVGERGLTTFTLTVLGRAEARALLADGFPGFEGELPGDGAVVGVGVVAGDRAPSSSALLRVTDVGPLTVVDVTALAVDVPDVVTRLITAGVRPVGERAWTAARVAFGAATVRGEGRAGLPQETGLGARVHPRKGCYLGQEIMARVEARGRLHRGLTTLALDGPPPALGAASGWTVSVLGGSTVGTLGSAAPAPDGVGWWALASVRHDAPEGVPWVVRPDGDVPVVGPTEVGARRRDA